MFVLNIIPIDAVNVFNRLDDFLLGDVSLVVLFRLLKIVWTNIPDLP